MTMRMVKAATFRSGLTLGLLAMLADLGCGDDANPTTTGALDSSSSGGEEDTSGASLTTGSSISGGEEGSTGEASGTGKGG